LLALCASLLLGLAPAPNPQIARMVATVDAARLKNTVDALVAFGTRNDFSETSSTATHGVFGARDWIASRFREIAASSGGRMTVALDTYLQPKTDRTPRAVTESSVIATLRGDEPGRQCENYQSGDERLEYET